MKRLALTFIAIPVVLSVALATITHAASDPGQALEIESTSTG